MKWSKSGGVTVVLTLSIIIFLLSLLATLLLNAARLNDYIKDNVYITAFFNTDLDEQITQQLSDSLITLRQIEGGKYVSAEEAMLHFKSEIGEDFIDVLGNNPLPASVDLHVKSTYSSEKAVDELVSELEEMPEVLEITYPQNIFSQLNKNRRIVGVWLGVFSSLMFIIAVVLINNTIRLRIYSDRFLIKTQQLIGATDKFICKPFLRTAIGWVSLAYVLGIFALILLLIVLSKWLETTIGLKISAVRQHFLQNWHQYGIMLFLLLLSAVAVVYIVTRIATKKYLNTPTDNLYG